MSDNNVSGVAKQMEKLSKKMKAMEKGTAKEGNKESKDVKEVLKASNEDSSDSSDDKGWVGPVPSEAAPTKKAKVLRHEKLYLSLLPQSEAYERSFMHRDAAIFASVAHITEFIVTASIDGHVNFGKSSNLALNLSNILEHIWGTLWVSYLILLFRQCPVLYIQG